MSETKEPYTIWVDVCAFRKDGTPITGNIGSSVRRVVIIESETWNRLVADVPRLGTTNFRVGTFE